MASKKLFLILLKRLSTGKEATVGGETPVFGGYFEYLQFVVNVPVFFFVLFLSIYAFLKLRQVIRERVTVYYLLFWVTATVYFGIKVFGYLSGAVPIYMYGRLMTAYTAIAFLVPFATNFNRTRPSRAVVAKVAAVGWWILAILSGLYFGYTAYLDTPPVWNTGTLLAASLTTPVILGAGGSIVLSTRKSTKLFHRVRGKLIGIPLITGVMVESLSWVLVEGGLGNNLVTLIGVFSVPIVLIPSLLLLYIGFNMPIRLQLWLGILPRKQQT
jgi:hypothetical protein